MAYIIADGDEKLFNRFVDVIKLNNDLFFKYEQNLIKENTEEVTGEVTKNLARNLKDVLSDEVIAEKTGLDIETVKGL